VRILAYVHGYLPHLPAGSETMLHEMLRALDYAGHDVAVVSTDIRVAAGHMDTVGPVPVYAMHPLPVADSFTADWLPDAIIAHHEHAQHALDLAHGLGVKAITLFHNDYRQAHAMMRLGPDLAVVNTHWVTRKLAPSVLGVNAIIVHPPVDRLAHRTMPGDAATLVNLFRMKGPDTLYRLARANPDLKFLGVKGGYGAQVVHSGYANVDVIESTQDMARDVWSRTRVLLMPSRYESWGKVAVEAMASGIPVVANNTPGLIECLGHAGTVIPRLQPHAWQQTVRTLMTDDAAWEAASARALARSDDIEAMRIAEMVTWVGAVERLA
jgi:hypothetical protein